MEPSVRHITPVKTPPSGGSQLRDPVLSVHNVTKTYPGVIALTDVSLDLEPGTVHALVGENGAGKSSLVKVITGALVPDSGRLRIGDREVTHLTPQGAQAMGISVIQQERQIVPDLSVAENVMLGHLPGRGGMVDWPAVRRQARQRLAQVGATTDVRRSVRNLAVAELQELEIARALSSDVRVLVMDEPTSALSRPEVERLFAVMRRLREHDVAMLYISHHLEEIFEIADVVTVMRDGTAVATRPIDSLDPDELVRLMLGREVAPLVRAAQAHRAEQRGEVVLEAREVHRVPTLHGVSVDLHAGEILCVTGAIGSGRRELARCLAGADRPDRGSVKLRGRPLGRPRNAIRRGVVLVPEDRKREGLLLELAVLDNLMIGSVAAGRAPMISPIGWRRKAVRLVQRLRVKTRSVNTPVRLLSGGNQQKIVVGRWLNTGAQVFVFDEPTAGVDVGAKIEIYTLLRELADAGAALVVFSSDFEEIKLLADRTLVLRRGVVAGELPTHELSDERLLALSLGGSS